MAEERSGKRFKEEKKQEMQQKSQEDVQREETFKTWLTGLHRRRKVCFREKVFFFSLVHEPFALLVIGPNSLVKGIGAPCPGRPNPLGHWFGVVLFVEPYFRPILLI